MHFALIIIAGAVLAIAYGIFTSLVNRISERTQQKIIVWFLTILFGIVAVMWLAVGVTEAFRAIF